MTTICVSQSPVWAILPVKRLDAAKQRLSGALTAAERRNLFRHMLDDSLAAISRSTSLRGVLMVTGDPEACSMADRIGARILMTESDEGQSAAVSRAAEVLSDEGVQKIITLPGDVPLMTAAEIDIVCASLVDAPTMTIVPNRDDSGSNSIACSPPCAVPFAFGEMSFQRHVGAARALQLSTTVLRLPGMALDIDVESDLVELLSFATTTSTQRFLVASGIAGRLRSRARPPGARTDPARQQRVLR